MDKKGNLLASLEEDASPITSHFFLL